MNQPIFSVIIPCFNRPESLCLTLESCLQQSFDSYEIILVDDCSTQDILYVFTKYEVEFKKSKNIEVRYFRLNQNRGPSRARNFGWERANGKYIAFLDSDDLWHSEKLSICYFFIDKFKPQCLYHDYSVDLNDMGEDLQQDRFEASWKNTLSGLFKNYSVTPSFIVLKTIPTRFNESMRFSEDYDLWLRLSFKSKLLHVSGFPLTILGRQLSSSGGLSENILKMRLGEMKMYTNICLEYRLLLPLLPILILFSFFKHIYGKIKY